MSLRAIILGGGVLLASVASASPGASPSASPGASAIAFLDRVRTDQLELARDTGLFPGTTRRRTLEIQGLLSQLGAQLERGPLEVIAEKQRSTLAATLVAQRSTTDPLAIRIWAIGLVQRDGKWKAGPVVGSFDNLGIDYIPSLAQTAQDLQSWMLEKRGIELNRRREAIRRDFLAKIQAAGKSESLPQRSPKALARGFIDACREGDYATMTALLGGLGKAIPDGWEGWISVIAAHREDLLKRDGSAIFRPSVLTLARPRPRKGDEEGDAARVDIFFYDPELTYGGVGEWESRPLDFARSDDGRWCLSLPDWLGGDPPPDGARPRSLELEKGVPEAMARSVEAHYGDTPQAAATGWVEALRQGDFAKLLGWTQVPDGPPAATMLDDLARLWRQQKRRPEILILLGAEEHEDHACALYHSLANLDEPEHPPAELWLTRGGDGWQVCSEPPTLAPDHRLESWRVDARSRASATWLDELGRTRLAAQAALVPVPPEADLEALVRTWLDSLRQRQPERALGCLAETADPESSRRALDFLSQEMRSSARPELVSVMRHGCWAAASVRHVMDDSSSALLHPIVWTDQGPRVLAEGILYQPRTRAHTFLNRETWKHLEDHLPAETVDLLRPLLKRHGELHPDF